MARKTSKKSKIAPKKAKRAMLLKKAASPAGFQLCIDFALFPDGTVLGPSFAAAGFLFAQNPGGPIMTVKTDGGEKGLRFPEVGMRITLPTSVSALSVRVGNFGGTGIHVQALDSAGSVLASQVANFPGTYGDVAIQIASPSIAALDLTGGNNEGVLARLCITIKVAD